jgi:hypothetical protein
MATIYRFYKDLPRAEHILLSAKVKLEYLPIFGRLTCHFI